ncbi:MAG: hypothetical protein ACI4WV_00690 [Eubacteriales bacterium]
MKISTLHEWGKPYAVELCVSQIMPAPAMGIGAVQAVHKYAKARFAFLPAPSEHGLFEQNFFWKLGNMQIDSFTRKRYNGNTNFTIQERMIHLQ